MNIIVVAAFIINIITKLYRCNMTDLLSLLCIYIYIYIYIANGSETTVLVNSIEREGGLFGIMHFTMIYYYSLNKKFGLLSWKG